MNRNTSKYETALMSTADEIDAIRDQVAMLLGQPGNTRENTLMVMLSTLMADMKTMRTVLAVIAEAIDLANGKPEDATLPEALRRMREDRKAKTDVN